MGLYDDFDRYQQQAKSDNTNYSKDDWQRAAMGVFGGPLGWYEAATGKRVLGQELQSLAGDTPAYLVMNDKDVYASMSPGDWQEFNKMNDGERLDFMTRRRTKLAVARAPKAKTPEQQKQEADEQAFQQWKLQKMRDLDTFSKQMGMSVDQLIAAGDAGVVSAGNEGRSQAGAASFGAGLAGGGISAMNTQRAVADAQQRYQMGRQQLGLQANTELLNQMGQMGREREDMRRYDDQMNIQMQNAQLAANQRNFAEAQGQRQGIFGLAGGVIGGMYGGPQGAALGYNLGSGLGGLTGPQYRAEAPVYKAPTRYGYGLGGGNNPFQGSQ